MYIIFTMLKKLFLLSALSLFIFGTLSSSASAYVQRDEVKFESSRAYFYFSVSPSTYKRMKVGYESRVSNIKCSVAGINGIVQVSRVSPNPRTLLCTAFGSRGSLAKDQRKIHRIYRSSRSSINITYNGVSTTRKINR